MEKIKRLQYLLVNNSWKLLFSELLDMQIDKIRLKEIQLLYSRYNEIIEDIRLGVSNTTDSKVEKNKLRHALIEVIDSISPEKQETNHKEEGYRRLYNLLSRNGTNWLIKGNDYDVDWLINFKSELVAILEDFGFSFSLNIYSKVHKLLFQLHNLSINESNPSHESIKYILEDISGNKEMSELGIISELKKEIGLYSSDEISTAIEKRKNLMKNINKFTRGKSKHLSENSMEFKGFMDTSINLHFKVPSKKSKNK